MKKSAFKLFAFLFLLEFLFFSCNSSVAKKSWTEDEIISKKHKKFINEADSYLVESDFQGSVLVSKKNKIIFAKGYGSSDSKNPDAKKNSIHTIFEAGSITKQITAAAIMQLSEQKKINVNESLKKFFPEYKNASKITVKNLLMMRSGLTDHINARDDFFPPEISRDISYKERNSLPLENGLVLKYFYKAPPLFKPDQSYFYCNTDYYLLSHIIEQVSGQSYSNYVKENIFKKAGMSSSNTDFQATTAKGYDSFGKYYSVPAEMGRGCGDLNTTVLDLFKWNCAFVNYKIVNKKSFLEMTSTNSYGYGIYADEVSILHGGNTDVFNSYNAYYFADKVSVIVLVNRPQYQTNATFVAGKLRKIWLSHYPCKGGQKVFESFE